MTGEYLPMPGFCPGLRIKDYSCFIWAKLMEPADGLLDNYDYNIIGNESSGPLTDSYDMMDNDMSDYENLLTDTIEVKTTRICNIYFLPCLALIGLIGNSMLMTVYPSLSRIVSSTYLYLMASCPADIAIILVRLVNEWLAKAFYLDTNVLILIKAQAACKVYPLVFNFFFYMGRWSLLLAVADGAIRSCGRHPPANSLHSCRAVLYLFTVLFIFLNGHYFWSFHLTINRMRTQFQCHFTQNFSGAQQISSFPDLIWPIVDFLVGDLIPLFVVLGGSFIILYKRCRGKDAPLRTYKHSARPLGVYELQILLASIGLSHVILNSPKICYTILKYYSENYSANTDSEDLVKLIHSVATTCEGVYFSLKFFIVLASSGVFRAVFRQMVIVTTTLKMLRRIRHPRARSAEEDAFIEVSSQDKWYEPYQA
ncbi:DgyrCDS5683 [Dimorphilus gyrociliatus]|uniref:DgyrCDS5683 n=1 Tax=Dimorphilus gyrociliatus TaxID=2664684 RepID=A0A7I8VM94_9ANNE|nr:DgyrCDS5683 [Dimorphilus gyrociliatus]